MLDLRVLRHRLRAHDVEIGNAVERLLQGHGDELLDLGGGEADRGGLDLDLGRRELGEDVDLRLRELDGADDQQGHGEGDDDEPELQALIGRSNSSWSAPSSVGPPRPADWSASSVPDLLLDPEQLGRPDGHDLGPRVGAVG